jgi:hypothetical protein
MASKDELLLDHGVSNIYESRRKVCRNNILTSFHYTVSGETQLDFEIGKSTQT